MMIKNIVFDMGNVLLNFDGRKLTEQFISDKTLQDQFFTEVFRSVEWIMLDRGTISEDEAVLSISKRLDEKLKDKIVEVLHHWYDVLYPIEGIEELIKELKDKGYELYVLSNASKTFHNYIHRVPGFKYFNSTFCSADYNMTKPEIEIYHRFYEVNNLIPDECIFIDDSPSNIEASIRTGMDGIVFHNTEDLRKKLKLKGII